MKEEGDEFGGQNPEYYNEIQVSVITIVFITTKFIIIATSQYLTCCL